ncbi:MAG: lipopolysaccharide biosynthesis protein [Sphingobium sp.]|nr:lipopolysaccharide biosynthesis protein [Sphingobium sp.]
MNTQSTNFEATEESAIGAMLPHLPTIIFQRKWLLIIPTTVGLIVGVALAFLLPVTFQSKATLLVEAPLLPEEVASDASSVEIIDQRMARIRQEVLSRTQLIDLINRNSLYQTELRIKTYSEVIEKMRNSIQIEPVSGNIQASGNGRQSTIAFSISFDYAEPVKAQAVLQSITNQIQQINSSTQSEQATNMVQFLTDQTEELQTQISALEGQILDIKSRNGSALAAGTGGYVSSPDLIQSQIIQIEQANAQLKSQRDLAKTTADRDPGVQAAEANLATLRATYTETHPDVILAKRRLEEAKQLAKSRENDLPIDRASTIDNQIAFNNRQIATLRGSLGAANSSVSAARQAPVVQAQVAQLQEKLDGLNSQYQRAAIQLRAARAGKRADDEQQGERLRMLESPTTPEKPISPNRPMLISAGLGLGAMFGIAVIMLLEIVNRPIRHVMTVTKTIGEPPLVVIPTIYAPGERGSGILASLWPKGGKKDDDDDDD